MICRLGQTACSSWTRSQCVCVFARPASRLLRVVNTSLLDSSFPTCMRVLEYIIISLGPTYSPVSNQAFSVKPAPDVRAHYLICRCETPTMIRAALALDECVGEYTTIKTKRAARNTKASANAEHSGGAGMDRAGVGI